MKPRAPETASPVVCPKCGHAQESGAACHRCGLMFAKFDRNLLPPDPAAAVLLWEQLRSSPEDRSRHQEFIQACLEANRLDYASRQYRLFSREPGRGELGEKMLEIVQQRAQALLAPAVISGEARRNQGKQRSRLWVWIALALCLGLLIYLLASTIDILDRVRP